MKSPSFTNGVQSRTKIMRNLAEKPAGGWPRKTIQPNTSSPMMTQFCRFNQNLFDFTGGTGVLDRGYELQARRTVPPD